MVACLLALGSNQGDRVANLTAALDELRRNPAIRVRRVSSLVETAPVGGPTGQGTYLNGAVAIETDLAPQDLLAFLLEIERNMGRQRLERWGPRNIDVDVLLYGDSVVESADITIPHPRMHERRFVLDPAVEIASDWIHPRLRKTVGQLFAALPEPSPGELGMRVILLPCDIQAIVMKLRQGGQRVGLVPTMGALHEGHLSLVRIARQHAEIVVATIFVNPAQFGPKEDFSRYPRSLEADLQALSSEGCSFVFVPTAEDIYPPGFSTYVEPPAVAQPLEGVCRPGHFRGVATIVLKLFNLAPAHFACFGQKDYQQLQVIRKMVNDLAMPIELVACPTVREPDGLAMSSRNQYLSPAERQQALGLSQALERAAMLVQRGERDAAIIVAEMRAALTAAGIERIDYVAIADPESLDETSCIDGPAIALIAAHVGKTRLIDNRLLSPG